MPRRCLVRTTSIVAAGRARARANSDAFASHHYHSHCSLRAPIPSQRTTTVHPFSRSYSQWQSQSQRQWQWQSLRRFAGGSATGGGGGSGSFSSSSSSSSSSSGRSSFRSFFQWYSKRLDTHPVSTKCVSAGLISSLGNVLAQTIENEQKQKQKQKHESEKQQQQQQQLQTLQQLRESSNETVETETNNETNAITNNETNTNTNDAEAFRLDLSRISRFAFLNVVFVAPVLHHWYQFINRAVPGRSLSRVLQRTFWDEFVFSPVYIPAFLAMLWKLEGATNDRVLEMIVSECPSIIVAEWAMWVPTMIVTFRFVPVKFQVLAINVVGVVWHTYLAYAANSAHSSSSSSSSPSSPSPKVVEDEPGA